MLRTLFFFIILSNRLIAQQSNIGGIINTYTPVLALNTCNNKITVEDASTFNTGDTVLMIQMKGAVIDSTNTAAFGTITDYKNAGNYELNYVKSKSGNIIELKNNLTRQYNIPLGKVQLVRVPYYQNANVISTLTCLPWDGNKGGVLVLNVQDGIILNANIDAGGKGFRGGNNPISTQPTYNCYENQYFYPRDPTLSSEKGEGIALISSGKSFGKGPLANGGGSGNSHNSGGAGGGNFGIGGHGGFNYEGSPCNTTVPFDNGGISGKGLLYDNITNKIFLGGGGGAGQTNSGIFQGNGGNGGGIIIIIANNLQSNNRKIITNGNDGTVCGNTGPNCHEGMGGGGAGGTVLLQVNNYLDNASIEAKGGKGGDMTAVGLDRIGPGGGGGGGLAWLANISLPANVATTTVAGPSGVCPDHSNDPWGATAGQPGNNLFSLQIPVDNVLFKQNIDSVRINKNIVGCNSIDVNGLGYTNTVAINSWQWFFGDGGTAITQNASHTYNSSGTYPVKLVATDINGCKDSITVNISVSCNNAIGNIINTYTPVLALNPCENKITVEDASTFNIGDTVLLIQMKGAIIDSTNTPAFGTTTDYRNAGNYEFNYVKSKAGNIVELKNTITRQYNVPDGKVQLVRVPYYQSVNITSTLTCLPWDGSKGGVIVLNTQDTVNLLTNIDVSGKGFKGGTGFNSQTSVLTCFQNNFYYPQSSIAIAGQKGESITSISQNINYGKGSPATGGGGGLGHNSGGGGGSNGGLGGFGGYQLDNCGNSPFDNRGIGGHPITYSTPANKIFIGGGGGAGQADNAGNIAPDGGNGGGIVIILSDKLKTNGNKIIANGVNAITCSMPPSSDCHDGMGGGGAGGSILLSVNQLLDNTTAENKGGKGADMTGSVLLGGRIGGGGGGSGGLLFIKNPSLPANLSNINTGGANGVLTQDAGNAFGATPGQSGTTLFNLVVPIDNTPFRPNIDSVRIKDTLLSCDSFDFKGLGYTNTNPVANWQWYFGDGGMASVQNTNHTYSSGSYIAKLVVTDINGCKDSISKNVTAFALSMDAGPSDTICNATSTVLQATSSGATQYTWAPAIYLNNATLLNPIATPVSTTMFYLTATHASGCTRKDSALVTVRPPVVFTISPPLNVCTNKSVQINASGGNIYLWQPAGSLDNANVFNPTAAPTNTTPYTVQITDTVCDNTATLSTVVTVLPLPTIKASKSNDIDCSVSQSQLVATGGFRYNWSPADSLNNANSGSPVAKPVVSTKYIVAGTDAAGCTNYDSVIVNVSYTNKGGYLMPTAFTPNNDGLNDCYGLKYWGRIQELQFSIYNRWGQRLFYTTNPSSCWDGRFKGVLQNPAVFVYMIKAKTNCEDYIFRKGTFALIR